MSGLAIVILAAGQGKRMRSKLPKVLHPLGGRPMIKHVLDTASALNPSSLVMVVGQGAEQVGCHSEAVSRHLLKEQRFPAVSGLADAIGDRRNFQFGADRGGDSLQVVAFFQFADEMS